jgi:hypothetical protein
MAWIPAVDALATALAVGPVELALTGSGDTLFEWLFMACNASAAIVAINIRSCVIERAGSTIARACGTDANLIRQSRKTQRECRSTLTRLRDTL